MVAALIDELRDRGIRVWAEGDRLQCNAPVGALTAELREQLRERKGEILEFLRGPAELSFAQERLWFLEQIDPGSSAYVIAQALELRGALDAALLERALAALVERHESLRTVFVDVDGQPRQIVSRASDCPLPRTDVGSAAGLRECLRQEAARGFDLQSGPLFRARLYRLATDAHVLMLTMHHIVSDEWSMRILMRELGELYRGLLGGEPATLPEPALQYRDFARMQRDRLQGEALQPLLARWRSRLADAPRLLELRPDRQRPAGTSRRGATFSFPVPPGLARAVHGLARSEATTPFPILVAAFALLLARHAGVDDLLVGIPVANRTRTELEPVVGCFVNTVVLRADLSDDPPARQFRARMREVCLDALADQDLPFERLVAELRPERDLGRNPMFQVMFAWHGAPLALLDLPGLQTTPVEVPRDVAQFDLMLEVTETPNGLTGVFHYAADSFEEATVARLATHWRTLLGALVTTPDCRVSELPMLGAGERHRLLVEWNRTAAPYPRDSCVHELLAAQVERTPAAIAVRGDGEQLTYRELERRANQLASRLRELGVGPDVPVGLCVERSPAMLVGMLGILEAGGAYVPIDPNWPAERVAFVLEDTRAPVLLTQARLTARLPAHTAATVCLDTDAPAFERLPAVVPKSGVAAGNLAYVMYTSGSTGKPKGACITHRGLVNYLCWAVDAYQVAAGSGAPVHSSFAFDLTVTSLFPPLLVGRTVELLPEGNGAEELASAMRRAAGYSLVKLTPAHLQLLQLQLRADQVAQSTRVLVIGGEQLSAEAVAFWRQHAPRTVIVNEYGPTETVVGCCAYRVDDATRNTGAIPIGRPIANTRLYLLDRHLQPVPIGVVGELYIGGDGVARGYLNRPDLTREHFVADPFDPDSPGPLYRTGDLARYLPDGNLEFLGRRDDQVKVRGYRIELGEIEAALRGLLPVRAATVALREDVPGEPWLVAYVVFHAGQVQTPAELRSAVRPLLPDYMLPSAFVTLDELPLTRNGKVDRSALPAPASLGQGGAALLPPSTDWETKLARVWQDVLRVEQIGAADNFFDLGGHSLLVVRLVHEINRRHGVSLRVADVFLNPTIGRMAKWIDDRQPRSRRRSAVLPMRRGRSEVPVYFIYAGPDEFGLAKSMSARHAVFGIDVPWPLAWREAVANDRRSDFPTMDQLVAPYVSALSAHVRGRACALVGHSFAGVIAFEAAHRLLQQGVKVETVVLLDTWARSPSPYRVALHRWLHDGVAPGRSHGIAPRLRSLWRTTRWLLAQEKERVAALFGGQRNGTELLTHLLDEDGMPLPNALIQRAYAKIAHSYRARPLDCRGVLFGTDATDDGSILRGFDEGHGWKDLFARGLEIVPMIGNHLTMIRQHHPKLAHGIDAVLRRHWPREAGTARADCVAEDEPA